MSEMNPSAHQHQQTTPHWSPSPPRPAPVTAAEPAKAEEPPTIESALADLVSNYRRPAFLADPRGAIVAMSNEAKALDSSGEGPSDRDLADWPHFKLEIQTEDGTYTLLVPELAEAANTQPRKVQLPPRLAKIARLVISGCTDKQIAARTGLSFSTVRTYVRQIYRRLNVHSRVELVHATSMGLTIE
ncbi:MAG: LuxR C-terminal-related transcriptional regulator [Nannocystaceae bacterium]